MPPAPPAAPPVRPDLPRSVGSPRRSQAERRATTRAALLDATVACLTELGISRTTTSEVVHRAGVSQGALFRHFATKDDLLAAAAAHVYDELLVRWRSRVDAIAPVPPAPIGPAPVQAALDLLWEMFLAPEFGAALELSVAARTDPGLRARLDPVLARHGARLRHVAADLFPVTLDDPDAAATVDLVLDALLGLVVSRGAGFDPGHEDRVRTQLARVAHAALAGARAPDPAADPGGPLPDPTRPREA